MIGALAYRDPSCAWRAGQGRDESVVDALHGFGDNRGEVGIVGSRLVQVDLLQRQDVRCERSDRIGQPVEVDPVLAGRTSVDIEGG